MMLFMDGFDYLTVADLTMKWDTTSGSLQTGVYGYGKCLKGFAQTATLGSNVVTGGQSFHFYTGTLTASTVCEFRETGSAQCDLRYDSSGTLFFTRNGTTIGVVADASTRLVSNTWYWIEAKVTISDASGIANVKVNGIAVLTQSSLDTKNTANAYFNQVKVNGSGTLQIDNYHVWDTTAGDVADYMGESVIETQLPSAAGSNADWTKNGGSTNFSRVNEANEDGDTTYVSSSTANQIDSYAFTNLTATSGTIRTIAVNTIDRNDDATPRTFDHYVKSSSATALSSNISPSAGYKNHQRFFAQDPNTTAAWTVAGRNAAEFGYKLIS
jgi:hypothetical protein